MSESTELADGLGPQISVTDEGDDVVVYWHRPYSVTEYMTRNEERREPWHNLNLQRAHFDCYVEYSVTGRGKFKFHDRSHLEERRHPGQEGEPEFYGEHRRSSSFENKVSTTEVVL